MQIVIPMSGFGERFRTAGYDVPKPLIEIDGKPIIAHVIDMFPAETDFLFICNQDHLAVPAFRMESILRQYAPSARVVGIAAHKLGPIHAILQVRELIDPSRPVVVNYCDFTCYWDWQHFKGFVRESACAGCIPAYKGFHPHSLGKTNYAYLRESQGWVSDVQEKQPFTADRMQEYASSGTYYFSSGRMMLDAFTRTIDQGLTVGGEYYVSLAYKLLLSQQESVAVYELQHFMQWGTPEDVAEYKNWSQAFQGLLALPASAGDEPAGSLVMPMAGLGQRFQDQGYRLTKPLIPVSGRPMVAQAAHDLPQSDRQAFVLRSDMPGHADISSQIQSIYPRACIEMISTVTEGQACTALIGLDALERQSTGYTGTGPITFGACDNGALYDAGAFSRLLDDLEVDVIVWGVRGYANAIRHPKMFGWIDADASGRIRQISVKTPLATPATDPIVLGTFTFRRATDFRASVDRLIARNGRINNEYYIDSAINDAVALGLRCQLFEVDSYLAWGTPDDLRTFEYWQSAFHKWPGHPYRLELDRRVPAREVSALEQQYQPRLPTIPAQR
ncbi:MAG: NTP transferase domain-containing protein [Pseudomonadota bacterium]